MVIERNNKCVKIELPNGKVADVLSPVLDEISKWIQDEIRKPESGGYIIGYQHRLTGNISLEAVSHPYNLDLKTRIHFDIRDPQHIVFLKRAQKCESYYMGVWHTHPQDYPIPSSIDWDDWNETLRSDKTGSQYVFFIIAGISQWRLWIGDMLSGVIVEGHECSKNYEGIYIKESGQKSEEIFG